MPSSSVRNWLTTRSVTWLSPPAAAAPRRQRVDLVEEHDAGRRLPRLLEDLADPLLGFADPLGEQLRPFDRDEVHAALVRDGLGQERLAAARRAGEQDALGRLGTGVGEQRSRSAAATPPPRAAPSSPPPARPRRPSCTSGTSANTSRIAEGSTSCSASRKSSMVDLELHQLLVGDLRRAEVDVRHEPAAARPWRPRGRAPPGRPRRSRA